MLIPIFSPYLWRLPSVAAVTVRRWNTVSNMSSIDTVAASAISCPILWSVLLCWALLICGRRRRSHQSQRCCSAKGYTVYVSPPIMPNLVLPCIYWRCPRRPAYLISSLSSVSLVILHIFCCPHRLTSLPHLFRCCLGRLKSPPHISASCFRRRIFWHPYPPSLSYIASDYSVLGNLCIPCRSHPLPSPPSRISASTIRIVLRLCHVSYVAVSIVQRLCHCLSPLLTPRPVPTSRYYWAMKPSILGAAFRSVGHFRFGRGGAVAIPVGRQPAIISGRQCSRFGRPRHPQPCVFRFWDAAFLGGVAAFVRNQIISSPSLHLLLLLHRDDSTDLINLVPVLNILMSLLAVI